MSEITSSGGAAFANSVIWVEIPGNVVALAKNKGYILNNNALTTATLPVAIQAGHRIAIAGAGTGKFLIAQNAGQSIKLGNISSTGGVMGSLASALQYDAIELLCIVDNSVFMVINSVGNFVIS